jgi:FkbM family methyltransferase
MTEILEIGGCKFELEDQSGTSVINEIFLEDAYKFENVPNKGTVLDIGANIGAFSIRCAVQKNCAVYSYEPGKITFDLLNKNIVLNNVFDKIRVHNQAISDKKDIQLFYYWGRHPAGSSLLKPMDDPSEVYETYEVSCVTIADAFLDNGLSHVDVLKVDAECAESLIFIPEFKHIISKAGYVALEWHTTNCMELIKLLNSAGFQTTIPWNVNFPGGILVAKNPNFKNK